MIRIPCGEYLGHGQATCWRHQNLQHQQTLFWPPGQNSVVQLKQLSAWLPPDQEWHMTEMPIWSKCPATILTALSRNFTPSSGCAAQSLRVSKISCPSKLNPFLSPDIWQYQTTRASGIEKPPILKMERMLKCVISTLHVHISIRHSQLKTALPSSTRQLTTQSGKGILVLSEVGLKSLNFNNRKGPSSGHTLKNNPKPSMQKCQSQAMLWDQRPLYLKFCATKGP